MRTTGAWTIGLAWAVACGAAACASGGDASDEPAAEAPVEAGAESEGGAHADAGDGGAHADAADASSSDAPHADAEAGADAKGDAKADATTDAGAPTGAAIYVSTTGDDNDPGTSADYPVRSVFVGIALAQKCAGSPCAVKIAEGTYADAITLASGVDLWGGYAPDFGSRDPAAHVTTITSGDERTVIADGLYAGTTIDGVTVQGAKLGGFTGKSSHAVWVKDLQATLTLRHVIVGAGQGEAGLDGQRGVPTTCSAAGGTGGTAFDCGASSGTSGTAGGDPPKNGAGGQGGGSYCVQACPAVGHDGVSDGADGAAGGDGAPGGGGMAPADPRGQFNGAYWLGPAGTDGARGTHGTGGGGGGSGGSKHFAACLYCQPILLGGTGANGANGGCAGGGGTAGGAGGGAFGLVVKDSTVVLDDVVVNGGAGGVGGAGGDGADGEPGGTSTGAGRTNGETQNCSGFGIQYYAANGGNGGTGGDGGPGGGGAGGAGGPAIGIALVGSTQISKLGNVTIGTGTPGAGGAGGKGPGNTGAPGPAGAAEEQLAY